MFVHYMKIPRTINIKVYYRSTEYVKNNEEGWQKELKNIKTWVKVSCNLNYLHRILPQVIHLAASKMNKFINFETTIARPPCAKRQGLAGRSENEKSR